MLGIHFLAMREGREDDGRRALSRGKSRVVLVLVRLAFHSLFENTLLDLSELLEEEPNERQHRLCVLDEEAMRVGDQISWRGEECKDLLVE